MTGHNRAAHPPAIPAGGEPASGELQPRVRVGRLDSVACWRKEVGRIYRMMRRGEMPADIGAKLTFVAQVGARLTQIEQELRNQVAIAEALDRARGTSLNGHASQIGSDQHLLAADAEPVPQ